MQSDPFGNLLDWGQALEILETVAAKGGLGHCQPGLVRILRYKGNWRLREAVLRCAGEVQDPSEALVCQLSDIVADENIYYDARILACGALTRLIENADGRLSRRLREDVRKGVERLRRLPQPHFLEAALDRLHAQTGAPGGLDRVKPEP